MASNIFQRRSNMSVTMQDILLKACKAPALDSTFFFFNFTPVLTIFDDLCKNYLHGILHNEEQEWKGLLHSGKHFPECILCSFAYHTLVFTFMYCTYTSIIADINPFFFSQLITQKIIAHTEKRFFLVFC
jgi:hypothetical protein